MSLAEDAEIAIRSLVVLKTKKEIERVREREVTRNECTKKTEAKTI